MITQDKGTIFRNNLPLTLYMEVHKRICELVSKKTLRPNIEVISIETSIDLDVKVNYRWRLIDAQGYQKPWNEDVLFIGYKETKKLLEDV